MSEREALSEARPPVVVTGFCRFCHNWLTDRNATEHATRDECLECLLRRVAHYQRSADREHDWVDRLEDVIAELRGAITEVATEARTSLWDDDGITEFGMDELARAINKAFALVPRDE